jgi:hypothetical protein
LITEILWCQMESFSDVLQNCICLISARKFGRASKLIAIQIIDGM